MSNTSDTKKKLETWFRNKKANRRDCNSDEKFILIGGKPLLEKIQSGHEESTRLKKNTERKKIEQKKKNRLRRKYRKKSSTSLTKQKKSTRELKLDT